MLVSVHNSRSNYNTLYVLCILSLLGFHTAYMHIPLPKFEIDTCSTSSTCLQKPLSYLRAIMPIRGRVDSVCNTHRNFTEFPSSHNTNNFDQF